MMLRGREQLQTEPGVSLVIIYAPPDMAALILGRKTKLGIRASLSVPLSQAPYKNCGVGQTRA